MKEMGKGIPEGSLFYEKSRCEPSELTSESLFEAANNGDSWAREIVEEIGVLNAIGFANIVNAFDPSLISVGGSVALKNAELVLPPIKKHIAEYALNEIPEIELTLVGEDVVVCGAIAAALRFTSNSE
jgi:glucokinase